jgi:hypothetical protein
VPSTLALLFLLASPPATDDFTDEARLLFHAAACGTLEPAPALPAALTAPARERHCQVLRNLLAGWKRRWTNKAMPFLANVVPAELPAEVVYPFGGGDLFTALATFPRAQVITTLSLEPGGDPVAFGAASNEDITRALQTFRDDVRRLSFVSHSKTTNLLGLRKEVLPDQLAFALMALTAFDCRPVSLRYFRIEDDGQLHYLSREELVASKGKGFANLELAFLGPGQTEGAPRLYRHLQANLSDKSLATTPGVMKHLESKGRIAAMTKAASYLLSSPLFKTVRDYLLAHADWMISDATGIPPSIAKPAGFEQETWGRFTGAALKVSRATDEDFVRLWSERPVRPLPFTFGYQDKDDNDHMMVTRRAKTP